MKRYIKSATDTKEYIDGKLYDLPDNYWEDYNQIEYRYLTQENAVQQFSKYYIIYQPDSKDYKFSLSYESPSLLAEITNTMRIKDGIDLIKYPDHLEIIGYYSGDEDIVKLYPISAQIYEDLLDKVDNSDFDESTTIENELAQYTWGGASVEQILQSFR
jgi:hypothetical protein